MKLPYSIYTFYSSVLAILLLSNAGYLLVDLCVLFHFLLAVLCWFLRQPHGRFIKGFVQRGNVAVVSGKLTLALFVMCGT